MAGRGFAPKKPSQRRTGHKPQRGEWQVVEGHGWSHGETPAVPFPLLPETQAVWDAWMAAWFASNWLPEDLPGLHITISLYDQWVSYRMEPTIVETDLKGN